MKILLPQQWCVRLQLLLWSAEEISDIIDVQKLIFLRGSESETTKTNKSRIRDNWFWSRSLAMIACVIGRSPPSLLCKHNILEGKDFQIFLFQKDSMQRINWKQNKRSFKCTSFPLPLLPSPLETKEQPDDSAFWRECGTADEDTYSREPHQIAIHGNSSGTWRIPLGTPCRAPTNKQVVLCSTTFLTPR